MLTRKYAGDLYPQVYGSTYLAKSAFACTRNFRLKYVKVNSFTPPFAKFPLPPNPNPNLDHREPIYTQHPPIKPLPGQPSPFAERAPRKKSLYERHQAAKIVTTHFKRLLIRSYFRQRAPARIRRVKIGAAAE